MSRNRRRKYRKPSTDYEPINEYSSVEGGLASWMETLEKIVSALFDYGVVLLKTTCSCLMIIASNPLGGALLFLFFIWWLLK